jgi:hypothetical protein
MFDFGPFAIERRDGSDHDCDSHKLFRRQCQHCEYYRLAFISRLTSETAKALISGFRFCPETYQFRDADGDDARNPDPQVVDCAAEGP